MKQVGLYFLLVLWQCGEPDQEDQLTLSPRNAHLWLPYWKSGAWILGFETSLSVKNTTQFQNFIQHQLSQESIQSELVTAPKPSSFPYQIGFLQFSHPSIPFQVPSFFQPSTQFSKLMIQQWSTLLQLPHIAWVEPNLIYPIQLPNLDDLGNIGGDLPLAGGNNEEEEEEEESTEEEGEPTNPLEGASDLGKAFGDLGKLLNPNGGEPQPPPDLSADYQRIRLDEALSQYESQLQDKEIYVAVIDSGVDYEHPQLKDAIFEDPNPLLPEEKNGIDGSLPRGTYPPQNLITVWGSDGEPGQACYSQETYIVITQEGQVEVPAPNPPTCGHGTHVAGIIAARPLEGSMARGVCQICRIIPINAANKIPSDRMLDPTTKKNIPYLANSIDNMSQVRGLQYLTELKDPHNPNLLRTNILNMSLGIFLPSRSISTYIDHLYQNNVAIVAAAGNSNTSNPSYPAAYGQVISVGSVGRASNGFLKSIFSNYGDWIDLVAPGYNIYSTKPGNNYAAENGTSQASPIVAGALGLLMAQKDQYLVEDLYQQLKRTSHFFKVYESNPEYRIRSGYQEVYLLGHGLLDVKALLSDEKQSIFENRQDRLITKGCALSSLSSSPKIKLLHLFLLLLFFRFLLWRKSYSNHLSKSEGTGY